MPSRIPGLTRGLGERSLASIAYGEIGSSLYFALGVVALHALGTAPWVLLGVGALFLLVSLSYAEGTAAIPEIGGAAMFVRRAFNDPAGFVTGWVLFLDYLIVIALAGLFAPHYLGLALDVPGLTRRPWDVVAGVVIILAVATVRLIRRTQLYRVAILVAALAFFSHLLVIGLGFAFLFSWDSLWRNLDLGQAPSWSALTFSLSLAMLAYTGLETVANLAAEAREPGRTLPRGLFAGIATAVLVSAAVAAVGVSAFPVHAEQAGAGWSTELGSAWLKAPIVGIGNAFGGELPAAAVEVLRGFLGLSGVVILIAAITTSFSGAGRLAYSLGQHGMLPHAFGRLSRRSLIGPPAIASTALIASAILVSAYFVGREVNFLASLYSFGVLLAFTAAQLAVLRLRKTEPALPRPFRVRGDVRIGGAELPLAALIGAPLTFAIWISTLVTHESARIAGPIWLALGIVLFVAVRRSRGETVLERVAAPEADLVPELGGGYRHVLVPVKFGPIGEEVLATAIRLAEENRGRVSALYVLRVPFALPLDAPLAGEEELAEESLTKARTLAGEHGISLEAQVVRSRAIGEAIVEEARRRQADLVVLGSAPRWRRQSRFFSPTVDYVLRHADCEVMVVTYPQGVLEDITVEE